MNTLPKRHRIVTPTEEMVDIDTAYMRVIMHSKGINQSELSIALGYCPEYVSNSIKDGRMQKELLKALSVILEFDYKKATRKKRK